MSRTYLVVGFLVALSSFCPTDAELNCDIGKFVQSSKTFRDFLEMMESGYATFYVTATSDKSQSLKGVVIKAIRLEHQWFLTHTIYSTDGSCFILGYDFYRVYMVGEWRQPIKVNSGNQLNLYVLAGDQDTGYLSYMEVFKDGVKMSSKFNLLSLQPNIKVDPQIAEEVLASSCDPPVDVQSLFQSLQVDPNVMDSSCTTI